MQLCGGRRQASIMRERERERKLEQEREGARKEARECRERGTAVRGSGSGSACTSES